MLTWLWIMTALLATPTEKRTLKADKAKSYVSYKAVHRLHAWEGKNKNVECALIYNSEDDAIEKVAVSMRVADFDSGNSSRDSHSLEVLEALKFPKVTFVSTSIKALGGERFKVTGDLSFHGVSKTKTFEVKRTKKSGKMIAEGTFSVLMTEHKIERPTLMLIPTDDNMDITLYMVFEM